MCLDDKPTYLVLIRLMTNCSYFALFVHNEAYSIVSIYYHHVQLSAFLELRSTILFYFTDVKIGLVTFIYETSINTVNNFKLIPLLKIY